MFRKILVATDGSEDAMRALTQAAILARTFESSITCVYVSYVPPVYTPDIGPELLAAIDEEGKRILELSQSTASAQDVAISTKLITRIRPPQAICKEAKEGSYDLVVVAARGAGQAGPDRIGTVSAEVIRHAPCSVLIVR